MTVCVSIYYIYIYILFLWNTVTLFFSSTWLCLLGIVPFYFWKLWLSMKLIKFRKSLNEKILLKDQFLCILLCYAFKNVYFLWLYWVFVAVHGLSLVVMSRGYSLFVVFIMVWSLLWLLTKVDSFAVEALGFMSFSDCGTRLSSCSSWALDRSLSSCGTQPLSHGMYVFPWYG